MSSRGALHAWEPRQARRGYELWASTEDFEQLAACKNDIRFVQRALPVPVVDELIAICQTSCPVMERCLLWAKAQIQPVGFTVAGGRKWTDWNKLA